MNQLQLCLGGIVAASLCSAAAGDPPVRSENVFLFASDFGDLHGASVDVLGDTIVSGAARDDGSAVDAGAVYTYDRLGSSWTPLPKLVALDAAASDFFGWSVELGDERLVVGSLFADGVVANTGAAYVYVRSGATWTQEAKLTASDGTVNDLLGSAVAMDGDTLVVGASGDDFNGSLAGSAYVFVRTGTTWAQQARLLPSDGSSLDRFGDTVAISGDTAVVGAPLGNGGAFTSGTAYVFVRSGTVWTQQAEIFPSSGSVAQHHFGAQVAVSGDTAFAGSIGADIVGTSAGAVYVFGRTGSTWSELDPILPSDGGGEFGQELDLDGDTLVVGAQFAGTSGQTYVYRRGGSVWAEEVLLESTFSSGSFPVSAAVSGNTVACGSLPFEKFQESSGVLFVYDLVETESFCDATDGSLASCPCGAGGPESGCDVAQVTGGVELNVIEQDTAATSATLVGSGFPAMSTPAAIVIRAVGPDAGSPIVFGDGLRCVGTPVVRLGAAFAIGGESTHTFGHGAMAGAGTFFYQLWFRNTPISYCDPLAAFNLSNGRTLIWP